MKNIITKSVSFAVESKDLSEDLEYYYFEGYASTFGNVDRGNDIVVSGAFEDSLKAEMPKMLFQHDMREVIGKYTKAFEDEKGLFVQGMMPKAHSRAKDVYALLKCGAIDSMSIGYEIDEQTIKGDKRYLDKLKLWEISLVTIPMNAQAKITNVKSIEALSNQKDFERFLKDTYGMGKRERKALLSKAKSFVDLRDVDQKEVTPRRDVDGEKSLIGSIEQKLDELINITLELTGNDNRNHNQKD